jgi:hypothetical protein
VWADADEEEDDYPLSFVMTACAADTPSRFSTGSMRSASVRVFGLVRHGAVVNTAFSMVIAPWARTALVIAGANNTFAFTV